MQETRYAICPLCDASCGISVRVEAGRIAQVRGDPADPLSQGHVCPKVAALADIHDDPDRVRQPLRRVGDAWHEVRWDEALDAVAASIADLQRRHGRDAVALYVGNPIGHSYSALLFGLLFQASLGTRNLYTANSVDSLARLFASVELYGNQAAIPVPDLDRTGYLLVIGANPVVSNGGTICAPGMKRRLTELRDRGAKLVVVDPRRTETALLASEHHFIRPGTDALLLAAMIRTILDGQSARSPATALPVQGIETLRTALKPFTPSAVSGAVGITAETIVRLATEFAGALSACAYGRMGTTVQEFGATTTWLIDVLNIVTGNLDRPGGAMFASPAVDLGRLARALGQIGRRGRWRNRLGGFDEFNGEIPVAALADEMETPGRGQIRGLLTYAGNPVLSLPNGTRIDRALGKLDLVVSMDLYVNETSRHAHWILPTSFGLEHDQYPLLFHALGVRNTAHYAPAILAKPPGVLHDWELFLELAARLSMRKGLPAGAWGRLLRATLSRLGPTRVLALLLRMGGAVRLADLERAPHGVDLGPLEPRLRAILDTPERCIRLAPPALVDDLHRLRNRLSRAPNQHGDTLSLIGRRHLRSNNSWMHNSLRLVRGRESCTLLMHPDDAGRRGLADGQKVVISSAVGRIEARLELSDEMMPGVVSLPHGWGHDRPGARLSVASAHPGVSVNDIVDDHGYDPVCGTSCLNGAPVSVRAAESAAPPAEAW